MPELGDTGMVFFESCSNGRLRFRSPLFKWKDLHGWWLEQKQGVTSVYWIYLIQGGLFGGQVVSSMWWGI